MTAYLKLIVSLISPAAAAVYTATQQNPGQAWPVVTLAALSSFLVWLVPNLPKVEKQAGLSTEPKTGLSK